MFEENENPVTEEVTENVEQPTEQVEGVETVEQSETEVNAEQKLYSEDELNQRVDELLAKKLARKEAKIRKEYDKKYGKLESVLRAGTGSNGDIEEMTNTFDKFYTDNVKGYKTPTEPSFNEFDMKAGAEKEVRTMIDSYDFDELEEEAERLAKLSEAGTITERERMIFVELGNYLMSETSRKELASIGVSEKELNNAEYIEFKKNLNPSMSEKDKYEMYTKYRPKPAIEPIGTMKGVGQEKVKDYYTPDEIARLTLDDLDDPKVWAAVRKSMTNQA